MELLKREGNRLGNYDYSNDGTYFITICVADRKEILSELVGTGVLDCPKIKLLPYGEIAEKYVLKLNDFYQHINVDKYVIMPDHIHLLITIDNGQSGRPVPTRDNLIIDNRNSFVAKFVGTFKRFCNKEYGHNIWQARYYDHVIRNQKDYDEKWKYIENNPINWVLREENLVT